MVVEGMDGIKVGSVTSLFVEGVKFILVGGMSQCNDTIGTPLLFKDGSVTTTIGGELIGPVPVLIPV